MSASTEKKVRQAAREAGTDKKTLAAQEEAKKWWREPMTTAVDQAWRTSGLDQGRLEVRRKASPKN